MHIHFDGASGASGDMILAALLDAGADVAALRSALAALPIGEFTLDAREARRGGLRCTVATVTDPHESAAGQHHHHPEKHGDHHHRHDHDDEHHHEHHHEKPGDHRRHRDGGHRHDHDHGDAHHHHHDHDDHEHRHGESHGAPQSERETPRSGPHRHLADLLAVARHPSLPKRVSDRAADVFELLARAEAAVHDVPVEEVHFHELSGVDTLVDVIGVCLCLEMLGAESVTASPPVVGTGTVRTAHGVLPVPAPATLEILKRFSDMSWIAEGKGELLTPTGAALLASLGAGIHPPPQMLVKCVGVGGGGRDTKDRPNIIRAIVGERVWENRASPATEWLIDEIEVNQGARADKITAFTMVVDDMTAEAIGYLCEKAFAAGAVEAYAVPAMMKKGRPGHEITVLAPPDAVYQVGQALWNESSTFGMRISEARRAILARETRSVTLNVPVMVEENVEDSFHEIRVKFGLMHGGVVRRSPEYEDCRAVALKTGLPFDEVYRRARAAADNLPG